VKLEEILDMAAVEAAPQLLGHRVTTWIDGVETAVLLTEVEAYEAEGDPASHSFRGRTLRNSSMFGPPGTLYVYRSYGIHWCMNIAVGPPGHGAAVLLRGGRIVAGHDEIERRRRRRDHLTDGPGKLCQALGVDGSADGTSVFDGPVVVGAEPEAAGEVEATPRVGISKAVDRPWRYLLRG
jgi:DNA-3-methyladenine glycosylase